MTTIDAFDEEYDLSEMAGLLAAFGGGAVPLQEVADACVGLGKDFKPLHPLKAAATFGGLLTQKRLQPNCVRLEVLVHLALVLCRGRHAPTGKMLIRGYAVVGQACGHLEDPPEDIFVGNIYSKRGNYRVLEGIWESGTFYLQRFVNLVDTLPDRLRWLADCVHALLTLSDMICSRAGLQRNELGSQDGKDILSSELASQSSKFRRIVQFSFDELERAGIPLQHLEPFIFDSAMREGLLAQSLSSSDLELRPIAVEDGQLYLLLPTAVSSAIRRLVLTVLGSDELRHNFLHNLANEYSRVLFDTPMLGKNFHRVLFTHNARGSYSHMVNQVDQGRYLQLLFVLDTLEEFEPDGFGGVHFGSEELYDEIDSVLKAAQSQLASSTDFRSGVTLVVHCGIGRGIALPISNETVSGWDVEVVSAPDYCTLCKTKGIEPLHLWRIIQMRNRLEKMNVRLQNINGLLNLYGWVESLEGHLVPHADIPEMAGSDRLNLVIYQNSLLNIRYNVVRMFDTHVQKFIDGSWRVIQTEGEKFFEEDNRQQLYAHLNVNQFLGACLTERRCWWYEVSCLEDEPSKSAYERWKMIGTWLPRAVRPLERVFENKLGEGPMLWRCTFAQPLSSSGIEGHGAAEEARNAIRINVDRELRTVELLIGDGFDHAIYNAENIAERELVYALVAGVAQFADSSQTSLDEVVQEIVPNAKARYTHMFPARQFRDHIKRLSSEPILINQFDDAALKLGLGWNVVEGQLDGRIEGKAECTQILNTLVRKLEDELCHDLRLFDRTSLLSKILLNHELASATRDRWHRTSAAILALRRDADSTLKSMREHELRLNAVFQAGRNLAEMCICESPAEGGISPGDADLSILLAKAAQLYHVGGWSDLIRWDVLEPLVVIRPLGDVHVKHDFMDTVMDGFGNAASEYRYMSSAQNYDKNLEPVEVQEDLEGKVEAAFLTAWKEELGADLNSYRLFVDAAEDCGIKQQSPVLTMRRSELINLAGGHGLGEVIVDSLTLANRSSWRDLPEGFTNRDIAPWRFRRTLSVLRRPLLQIAQHDDPTICFAPGMVRDALVYMVRNYYEGAYPDWHLGPSMRKYAGNARIRDGMDFNKRVVSRMHELGWQAEPEVTITKILRKRFERNFGDVDVLAWDPKSRRILIIECKDLQFKKTYGEIGEQLSDFRGEASDGKRDMLRKHLDRVELLQAHREELQNYLGLTGVATIESHFVFSSPVPMQFVKGPIRDAAHLHTYDELSRLDLISLR